ncbi:MAG TPA: NIPSNAP family protein, partial [Gaiellaceae bacterium]|nr:NIPSNAP family protein [Gaiellaceae bacterium]
MIPCAAILCIGLRLGIVELRQYTLRPGQRDVLIDLFARELVAGQEALGMTILGQFRDLNDPDRFVWVRGFRDMATRPGALEAFYTGPVWKQHGKAANATMIDSDDVLLLRPAGSQPPGDFMEPGLVVAGIHYFDEPVDN